MDWRGFSAAGVGLFILGLAGCEKSGSGEARCDDIRLAPAQQIAACTTAIETGNLQGDARAAALASRGDAHLRANHTTQALRDFEASLTLDNKNLLATRGRAAILLDSGQLDSADALVERLIAGNPNYAEPYLMKGRILFGRGDYINAMAQFDKALAKDSHLAQALALRGRSKEKLGDDIGARSDYDAANAITPPRADALAWRCWMRLPNRSDNGVRADGENAVRADPRFVEGQTCIGVVHLRAGEWADAKAAFEAALVVEPGNPVALFGRGVARRRGGDGQGSHDIYQAIEFNSHVRELFLSLGVETY